MRLVQLVSDTDRRGAQVFATALEPALRQRGHEVETWALVAGSSSSALELPTLASSRWWTGLTRLRRVAAGCDLVIAHGSVTLPACAVALGGWIPFVYRSIGDLPQWVGGGSRRRRVRWMLGRSRGVSVLWPELVPYVIDELGIDPADVAVIPNAVDTSRFTAQDDDARQQARRRLGLAPDRVVIAHVGALSPEKQVALLVRAAATLDAELVLAGEGPEGSALLDLATATGTTVHALGTVEDPTDVYAAADVVALASATEGQPAVLIEAALSARAVVAPRVGGVAAVVDDGTTGVLYDGGLDQLSAALRRALGEADRLGQAGPSWARHRFDTEVIAEQWDHFVRSR